LHTSTELLVDVADDVAAEPGAAADEPGAAEELAADELNAGEDDAGTLCEDDTWLDDVMRELLVEVAARELDAPALDAAREEEVDSTDDAPAPVDDDSNEPDADDDEPDDSGAAGCTVMVGQPATHSSTAASTAPRRFLVCIGLSASAVNTAPQAAQKPSMQVTPHQPLRRFSTVQQRIRAQRFIAFAARC